MLGLVSVEKSKIDLLRDASSTEFEALWSVPISRVALVSPDPLDAVGREQLQ